MLTVQEAHQNIGKMVKVRAVSGHTPAMPAFLDGVTRKGLLRVSYVHHNNGPEDVHPNRVTLWRAGNERLQASRTLYKVANQAAAATLERAGIPAADTTEEYIPAGDRITRGSLRAIAEVWIEEEGFNPEVIEIVKRDTTDETTHAEPGLESCQADEPTDPPSQPVDPPAPSSTPPSDGTRPDPPDRVRPVEHATAVQPVTPEPLPKASTSKQVWVIIDVSTNHISFWQGSSKVDGERFKPGYEGFTRCLTYASTRWAHKARSSIEGAERRDLIVESYENAFARLERGGSMPPPAAPQASAAIPQVSELDRAYMAVKEAVSAHAAAQDRVRIASEAYHAAKLELEALAGRLAEAQKALIDTVSKASNPASEVSNV